MKQRQCYACGKTKWTRRHHQENWTCARCIRKIQLGRRIKRVQVNEPVKVHAVN